MVWVAKDPTLPPADEVVNSSGLLDRESSYHHSPPTLHIRRRECAVCSKVEIVNAGVCRAEYDIKTGAHEDRNDGSAALSIELNTGRGAQKMGSFQIPEHVCRLLGCTESNDTGDRIEQLSRLDGQVASLGHATKNQLGSVANGWR